MNAEELNIQDEVAKIHHKYGTSELANFEIQKLFDRIIESRLTIPNRKMLCPKCNGQGTLSKPPEIPGDIHEWTSGSSSFTCNLCNGAMVIPINPIPNRKEVIERANAYFTEHMPGFTTFEYKKIWVNRMADFHLSEMERMGK